MKTKKSIIKNNCIKLFKESEGFKRFIKLANNWMEINEELSKKLLTEDDINFFTEYPEYVKTQKYDFLNGILSYPSYVIFGNLIKSEITLKVIPFLYDDISDIEKIEPEYYKKLSSLEKKIEECSSYLNRLGGNLYNCTIADYSLLKNNFPKLIEDEKQ